MEFLLTPKLGKADLTRMVNLPDEYSGWRGKFLYMNQAAAKVGLVPKKSRS